MTLECIHRHYSGEPSNKFGEVLDRYSDFFALFRTLTGTLNSSYCRTSSMRMAPSGYRGITVVRIWRFSPSALGSHTCEMST
ncbi:DUF6994 family protein [Arthrobacter ginsengisoli]|uniref:DUF6994 family protein n=1 Tax=Arthrobacter ginsengisoli TaxID=1356565 RepID=UPI0035B51AF9